MKRYDLNPTSERYYSQRNNAIAPGVTCKPTAAVMCLAIAGWPLGRIEGPHAQPEDNLTALCRGPEGVALAERLGQAGTPPNELWPVIATIANGLYLYAPARPIIGPRWDWSLREVLSGIAAGRPFAASTWLTRGGHVVAVVGYETEEETNPAPEGPIIDLVRAVIVDDPYGDRTSRAYVPGASGYHCRYPLADWLTVWRSTGCQVRRA